MLATTTGPAGVRSRPITAARGSSLTMIIFRGVRKYKGTGVGIRGSRRTCQESDG